MVLLFSDLTVIITSSLLGLYCIFLLLHLTGIICTILIIYEPSKFSWDSPKYLNYLNSNLPFFQQASSFMM